MGVICNALRHIVKQGNGDVTAAFIVSLWTMGNLAHQIVDGSMSDHLVLNLPEDFSIYGSRNIQCNPEISGPGPPNQSDIHSSIHILTPHSRVRSRHRDTEIYYKY